MSPSENSNADREKNASSNSSPTVLLSGRAYVESPRWHDGRLWFPHWGTGEIVAVDLDGHSEVTGHGPAGLNASILNLRNTCPGSSFCLRSRPL